MGHFVLMTQSICVFSVMNIFNTVSKESFPVDVLHWFQRLLYCNGKGL